jgi:uncharacterized repeat protein (TIGR03803 family)
MTKGAIATFLMLGTAVSALAQFETLANFTGTNGSDPFTVSLVQGKNGDLYGTTETGGVGGLNNGTVFKMTPKGVLTTLYSFGNTPDGANPYSGLVLGSSGDFFGTTFHGGTSGDGTVFKITSGGELTILYSFNGLDGNGPMGPLVEGSDGAYYGTTQAGGTTQANFGTVFKITPDGALTTLHNFNDTAAKDGYYPYGGLVLGSGGDFFGTTLDGGSGGYGTIFKISSTGAYKVLHNFVLTDGADPWAALIQAADGDFYGTTDIGGTIGGVTSNYGTVFKITAGGAFTSLHSFSVTDGYQPTAGLIQASDGNFYGTTTGGGEYKEGNVFEMTPGGTVTTLYSFSSGAGGFDGSLPYGGLVQRTSGGLVGTTSGGGQVVGDEGTVFGLGEDLPAFVTTVPARGAVGTKVTILGTAIADATSVTFNGVTATISANTASHITTTVPTGASTGTVEVVSPHCTCKTLVDFVVP